MQSVLPPAGSASSTKRSIPSSRNNALSGEHQRMICRVHNLQCVQYVVGLRSCTWEPERLRLRRIFRRSRIQTSVYSGAINTLYRDATCPRSSCIETTYPRTDHHPSSANPFDPTPTHITQDRLNHPLVTACPLMIPNIVSPVEK